MQILELIDQTVISQEIIPFYYFDLPISACRLKIDPITTLYTFCYILMTCMHAKGISIKHDFIVYRMGRLCGGSHEISGIKAPIFLHMWVGGGGWRWGWWGGWCGLGGGVGGGGLGVVGWVVVGCLWWGGWWVVSEVIRLSFQSNSNSQKLSLWC